MLISVYNQNQKWLFDTQVDPADLPVRVAPKGGDGSDAVDLDWQRTIDADGHVTKCPVCGCRELFSRKDFPQGLGLALVIAAGLAALVLFAISRVLWAFGVLGATALIDAVIYMGVGRCLVCYRCRSEYRDIPVKRDQPGWDLAIGEKYRPAT